MFTLCVLAGVLRAQVVGSGDQRVLHIWVDPYFGASVSGAFPFGVWSNFVQISHFDANCRAVDTTNNTNVVALPSTVGSPGPYPSTLRFTLEFAAPGLYPTYETGRLFDMPSNVQSFTVWIEGGGN